MDTIIVIIITEPVNRNIIVSQRSQSDIQTVSGVVRKLRSIAVYSLARMYRLKERLFAFRLRRNGQSEILEGVSRRYTATALIGLAGEDQSIAEDVLGNQSREDICGQLISDFGESQELGEVALTTWAARMLKHPCARKAIGKLRQMDPASGVHPTVELSWALMALVVGSREATDLALAERIAGALNPAEWYAACKQPPAAYARL